MSDCRGQGHRQRDQKGGSQAHGSEAQAHTSTYTAEINGENPFAYLTALLSHAKAVLRPLPTGCPGATAPRFRAWSNPAPASRAVFLEVCAEATCVRCGHQGLKCHGFVLEEQDGPRRRVTSYIAVAECPECGDAREF